MSDWDKEGRIYDLSVQDLGRKVTDRDRIISEAVYKNKQYLGPRGMVEYALVIARELEKCSDIKS